MNTLKDKLVFVLIIFIVVALGMFIFNQWLDYKYKAELLLTPCELCMKLNTNQSTCIRNCFSFRINATTPVYYGINISALNLTT